MIKSFIKTVVLSQYNQCMANKKAGIFLCFSYISSPF